MKIFSRELAEFEKEPKIKVPVETPEEPEIAAVEEHRQNERINTTLTKEEIVLYMKMKEYDP